MKNVKDFYNKTATGWSDEFYKEKQNKEEIGSRCHLHEAQG